MINMYIERASGMYKCPNLGLRPSSFLLPSTCIITLMRSIGDAMNCANAPDVQPISTACLSTKPFFYVEFYSSRKRGKYENKKKSALCKSQPQWKCSCLGAENIAQILIEDKSSTRVNYFSIFFCVIH